MDGTCPLTTQVYKGFTGDWFNLSDYSAPGYWYKNFWFNTDICIDEEPCTAINYSSKLIIETFYQCGGEQVEYGCQEESAFDGNCCDEDGCFNLEYYHIKEVKPSALVKCQGECCIVDPGCGNGIIEPGEDCDDGNRHPGDGCSEVCVVECNWECPTPGQPCSRIARRELEEISP